MTSYLIPVKMAALFFPIIAMIVTIPFAIYQYRKYGYINKLRTFIIFSFIFYLLAAYYLVILPLPESRDVKSTQSVDVEYTNFRPFKFIEDILRETKVNFSKPETYYKILSERAFLQVILNIMLMLPLGMYLRYYFKRNFKETIMITFGLSLFFEITQLTGLYGIYNAPYRIFDIDDLMLNTLGGIIGYGISPMINLFLPEVDDLDKNKEEKILKVGYFRRLLGFLVDMIILRLIPGINYDIRIKFISYFIYFIIIPYFTNGRTLGSWATLTRIIGEGERISFKEIFIRNGILIFGIIGVNSLFNSIIAINTGDEFVPLMAFLGVIQIVYYFYLIGHFSLSMIRKKSFFYEKLSKTRISSEDPEKEKRIRAEE